VKNYRFIWNLIIASVLLAAVAAAQSGKSAFVDSEKILGDLPEAQQASKELDAMVKAWQDSVQQMSDNLQKQVEDFQNRQSVMSQANKDAEQKRLQDLNQQIRDYYTKKLDPRTGEAALEREKRLAPIRDKVLKAIEVVAKEEGYTFVFDKANLLYGDARVDLTYKVLDRLKRGSSSKGK
jgi:outer membrane protein